MRINYNIKLSLTKELEDDEDEDNYLVRKEIRRLENDIIRTLEKAGLGKVDCEVISNEVED